MKTLETTLRSFRESGRKALVPYVMAGISDNWTDVLDVLVDNGADLIEIGLPFSDPMMDGVVIQSAGLRALERGTTLDSVCADLATWGAKAPLVVMTYFNVLLHEGLDSAAKKLRAVGVVGAIVPDLTLEEATQWRQVCDEHDIANILMVAPSTPPVRVATITEATEGFAYASARMAVTGVASDEGSGARVVEAIRQSSDIPAYVGIGISTPAQAGEAAKVADGVIVGSALVQLLLDEVPANQVGEFIADLRGAL
jgi:tryptophan synthase alpha chain